MSTSASRLSRSIAITKGEPSRETSYVYAPPSHRLLFRGSLSVPGSRMLLEGLTFTVPLCSKDKKHSPTKLLENPLALALESMRGRTLALAGSTRLDSVYLDKSTEVNLDIHPDAVLSQLYFENQLCIHPITSSDGTTDVGVRITLGDPESESSSDIIVYGQLLESSITILKPSTSANPSKPPTLRLLVARILPTPPKPVARIPRPDDPAPRVPPLVSFGKKRASDPTDDNHGHKKLKSTSLLARSQSRETVGRLSNLNPQRSIIPSGTKELKRTGSGRAPLDRSNSMHTDLTMDDDVFKVPTLPTLSQPQPLAEGIPDIAKELEKANKATIKRAAVDCLSTYGIAKDHPEFKELFSFIYRGAEFALRAQTKLRAVDMRSVDRFIKSHAEMYIRGTTSRTGGRSS